MSKLGLELSLMIDALNIATNGLINAEKRAGDAAGRIVKGFADAASSSPADLPDNANAASVADPAGTRVVEDIVDLKTAEIAFKASAKVFKTADEMLGTLLDEEA